MKEPVSGEALRHSVNQTMERYPYMKIRVHKTRREILLEENNEPIVVKNTDVPVVLGSEDVNGTFCVNCFQQWKEDTFFTNFLAQLDKNGIPYHLEEHGEIATPGITGL